MSKFSVRKPLTVFVAALAVLILGIVAFVKMTPDLLPNMDFPYVVIMTTYPGASPETVEEEVSKPLEQSMSTLEHIVSVSSTSSENVSIVTLEFEEDVNMDTIGVDIQQNIASLSGSWSDTVGTPYVLKINPSLLPVEVAAVSMDGMDTIELSDFINDTILPRLDGVTGVARISTIGSIERQVHVFISEDKIDAVNNRMADSVNQQLDDAAAELEDTRAELKDAQDELDSAQSQISSGSSTLASQTAEAESTLNKQQVAALQARMELQQQIVSLTETRTQLASTLEIVSPLLDSITALEEKEAELEARIEELTVAEDELAEAEAALQELKDRLAELEEAIENAVPLPEPDEDADEDAELPDPEDITDAIDSIADSEEYANTLAAIAELEARVAELRAAASADAAELAAAQAELAAVQAQLAAIDATLEALDMSRDGLSETVAEMQSGIEQADSGIEELNEALTQLDDGAIQISEAMATVSASKSAGLIQLADAAAQLAVNSAALDSALEQVDAGLEQLEDSREDALASADISGSITMSSVASILSAQNFSMPAGYVTEDDVSYMVSVGDELTEVEELENLLLFDTGEDGIGPVYLKDVADIFVTDNSDSSYARLNGEAGLILSFEKQSNAATAEVTDALSERFASLEAEYPGLHFVSLMDQGEYIHIIINSILQSLLTGALFAIIILFLFLRDIRPTFITLVSIPLSLVFAIVLMYFTGVSINMISLSGLAVAVGMLVDNSIVVIENIYRLRAKGATAVQAAVAGTKQVAGAITASTLTTVCVFLPIVFVEGITKQLFTDLALTMGYSLLASLIVALTLVPAMSRGMLKKLRQPKLTDGRPAGEGRFYRVYRRSIAWALGHKWVVLPFSLILLIGSAVLAFSRGFSFMPEMDSNTVNITITMPEDISRDDAVALADEALSRIETIENVENIGAMMGGTSLLSSGTDYDVTVYVTLPEDDSGAAAGQQILALCADMDCDISVDSQTMSMSMLTGSGVEIHVYGSDMEDLQAAAQSIADALEQVPTLENTDSGLEEAQRALHVRVDRNAAMEKGYTVAQLYMEIAAALTDATTAMSMDINDITADVLVETGDSMTQEQLARLSFEYTDSEGNTQRFRLRDVAEIEDTVSLASIRRADQRRYISVTAAVRDGQNVTLATTAAEEAVAALELPDGVTYEFAGENETIMEAVEQLGLMLLLGFLLVYFIMVAQFQSLKNPFIVMFTIPLAFTGGFLALLVCGMDVSIVSLIGFIMLTGIIVNNGIVLVDYVNQLRAAGMERHDALIEAGVTRLRPILMTSLTTILGLIIMALGRDAGTALMQPIAVVCIGGLLYATLMTLYVVPCIYDMMNKKPLVVIKDEDLEYAEL